MRIFHINSWNPFSDVHKKARENFWNLDLYSKIKVVAGTAFAAVATFFIFGLGGICVFELLTSRFSNQTKNRDQQDLKKNNINESDKENEDKELDKVFDEFFFSAEKSTERSGFDDKDLVSSVREIPLLHPLIKELNKQGFRYSGDTNSDSKAYTDIDQKKIYIGKDKDVKEACLSLAYELTNAKNTPRLKNVCEKYLNGQNQSSQENAERYAHEILKIEAEAVFYRSVVAISLKIESLIKNSKYLDITREIMKNPSKHDFNPIFEEMKNYGTVHNGKKKAVEHYIEQYWQYNQKDQQVVLYTRPIKFVLADVDV